MSSNVNTFAQGPLFKKNSDADILRNPKTGNITEEQAETEYVKNRFFLNPASIRIPNIINQLSDFVAP